MRDPRFDARPAWAHNKPPPPEEIERVRALGRQVALSPPSIEFLNRAHEKIIYKQAEIRAAFYDDFAAVVREDDERQRAWVGALFGEVKKALANPDALDAQANAWKEEPDPFDVWDRRYENHGSYEGGPFFPLSLLLRINPGAWCEAIDDLPSPGMMKMALVFYTDIQEDRDRIEELLRLAPPVFDAQGHWVASRSVVALLITEKIIAHAQALHAEFFSRARLSGETESNAAKNELRALEEEELPNWIRNTFRILLARPDGRPIALGLLGYLGKEILGQRSSPGGSWAAEQQAVYFLAEVLASAGLGVSDVRGAWINAVAIAQAKHAREKAKPLIRTTANRRLGDDQGEGARTLRGEGLPLLLGAAVMLGHDPTSSVELEVFWRWFEELLVGRDPGLSLVEHGSSMVDVAERFGVLLSRTPDPGTLFRETYVKLEPQRRRAMFAYRYEGFDHDLGSALLLRVGLNAAASWSEHEKKSGNGTQARSLFWWLYEAARRLWLTSTHAFGRTKPELVPLCFAFMPFIFGNTLGDALQRAVPPIANDAWMISAAGWFLWKNGTTPDRLVPMLREAGADIETALRDAYQWAKLTEVRSVPASIDRENPEFPATYEEFARALGISLEKQAAEAPPQIERTRRRGELARSIPWGAALLRRLDEDGYSLRRIAPRDAKGSGWFLQVSVPTALRERFGLSPEARVLVVHGQVRGRDLRETMQDPEGAALVDPDLIIVASDQPELEKRLPMLAGPWGQRIPWPPTDGQFAPLADALRERLPTFDLFDYRDPVRGSALVGRRAQVDDLAARLLRGEAVGVVGLRKVGKSSLLRAVAEAIDPIGARRGMFESLTVPLPNAEPEALVVSLDVQAVAGRGLPVLLDRLSAVLEDRLSLAKIASAPGQSADGIFTGALLSPAQSRAANDVEEESRLPQGPELPTQDPMERLRGLLKQALERTSLPVCFILDEYDLLFEGDGGEPGMPGVEQLFSLLRAEAQATRRVSLALIGRDPSFLDRPLLGGFTNPLAGWAKPMFLGPLRRGETEELLVRLGKRMSLDVGKATLEAAWQLTGGHPLLVRQYGAVLFEVAHTPPSRPRPVETDPIHADAVQIFHLRPAVHTICMEVHALLDARYPEALALAEALSQAAAAEASAIVERYGGTRARALDVLDRFGIAAGSSSSPWVPGVFREWFAPSFQEVANSNRSAASEA